jgi:hypothetical protein
MPISTHWSGKTIHWKLTGEVTLEELNRTIIDEFYNDERSLAIEYEIFDYTDAMVLSVTEEDVIFFSASDIGRGLYKKNVHVIFVGTNGQIRHYARHYASNMAVGNPTWKTPFFDTLEEAIAHLAEQSVQYVPPAREA